MNDKKVVFILSTGHSGSTLLELILNSHPKIFGLGELSSLSDKFDHNNQRSLRVCGVCEGECQYWNYRFPLPTLRSYFSNDSVFRKMTKFFNQYRKNIYQYFIEWTGSDILIDNSKNWKWIAEKQTPASQWKKITPLIIYLTRDGRAVINSLFRRYPERGLEETVLWWKRRTEKSTKFFQNFPADQRIQLSYERLADAPSQVTKEICQFLQIDYHAEMLEFWRYEHHPIAGNLGTESLIFQYQSNVSDSQREISRAKIAQLKSMINYQYGEYYEKHELSIRPDTRWKEELTEDQQRVFENLAGETNRSLNELGSQNPVTISQLPASR